MKKAALPENEGERLERLRDYDILDTLPEQDYDDITYLASQICDTPIAVISLVDDDRQWFKSAQGLDVSETPRDVAFCAHTILEPDKLMVVEDASQDDRFADNPLVAGDLGIRFYAGAPLVTASGHALGTLCVIDQKPRGLTDQQRKTLAVLARQVVALLELRRSVAELKRSSDALHESHQFLALRGQQLNRSRDELAEAVRVLEGQADVIEQDLHRAEVIQRSLLPHEVPRLEDFSVRSLYRPGHTVGGDLYDVVSIADRYLAIVVADACGHGVSAAMLSVLFKQHLRLQDPASGIPYPPAWALERINRSVVANRPAPGVFLTAVYALVDTQTRKLKLGSAGHPPVICLRASGEVESFAHTGPVLGLDESSTYEEAEIELGVGDKLLFYTDGLLDICESSPTVEALGQAMVSVADKPNLLEQVLMEVTHGRARPDCDDVTMVLLDAAPGESVFNESVEGLELQEMPTTASPTISWAASEDGVFLILEGWVTWLCGETLFNAAMPLIKAHRRLVIDLELCEHMDSTMFGTLHELIQEADRLGSAVVLQHVGPRQMEDFEELSMAAALAHVVTDPVPVPSQRTPLELRSTSIEGQQRRLLQAHEALLKLSDANRDQFGNLVDNLREELEG